MKFRERASSRNEVFRGRTVQVSLSQASGMTEKIDSFMARAGIAEDVLVQNDVSALSVLDVLSVGLLLEQSAVRARNKLPPDVLRSRLVALLGNQAPADEDVNAKVVLECFSRLKDKAGKLKKSASPAAGKVALTSLLEGRLYFPSFGRSTVKPGQTPALGATAASSLQSVPDAPSHDLVSKKLPKAREKMRHITKRMHRTERSIEELEEEISDLAEKNVQLEE